MTKYEYFRLEFDTFVVLLWWAFQCDPVSPVRLVVIAFLATRKIFPFDDVIMYLPMGWRNNYLFWGCFNGK